jgi:hypothetical protein
MYPFFASQIKLVIQDAVEKAKQAEENHRTAVSQAVEEIAHGLMVELLMEVAAQVMREQNAVLVHTNRCHYDEVMDIHLCPFINRPEPHYHFVPGTMVHVADEIPTRERLQMRHRGVVGIGAKDNRDVLGQKVGDGILAEYGKAETYIRKTTYASEEYYSRGHLPPPTDEEVEEQQKIELEQRVEGHYDEENDNQWVAGNGYYGEEGEWVSTKAEDAAEEDAAAEEGREGAGGGSASARATTGSAAALAALADDPDLILPCLISASHDGIFKVWDVDSMDDIKAQNCVLQLQVGTEKVPSNDDEDDGYARARARAEARVVAKAKAEVLAQQRRQDAWDIAQKERELHERREMREEERSQHKNEKQMTQLGWELEGKIEKTETVIRRLAALLKDLGKWEWDDVEMNKK